MTPDALKSLTVSSETQILMNLLYEVQEGIQGLSPLLDLLNTPIGTEEKDMIQRLFLVLIAVEKALDQEVAERKALEARLTSIEDTQAKILGQLQHLSSKMADLHGGMMPVLNGSGPEDRS